jgi:hypothetical protein
MGEVVSLTKHRPHLSGEAICGQCRHTWVAVALSGTTQFECPECKSSRGVLKWPFGPSKDALEYRHRCGGFDFFIQKKPNCEPEVYCRKCGELAEYWK